MVPREEEIHPSLQELLTTYARDHQLRFTTDTYHDVRWYQLAWWRQGRQNFIKLWLMPDGLQVVLQQYGRYESLREYVRNHNLLFLLDWAMFPRGKRAHRMWGTLPKEGDYRKLHQTLEEAQRELDNAWLSDPR